MHALLPPDEEERLKALRRYEILDTAPEQEFDDITLLASHICGTPIALISLVDEDRQWFKSKIGMTESETSRDIAFCAHGILQAEVLVVNDARADKRFAANPMVTGNPKIRFYAGAPLITSDGHALGMLCVNDQVPRELSKEQIEALQALSRQVVIQLELRRSLSELEQTVVRLKRTEDELNWKTAFLEAQANSSIDGIVVVDQHGTKIFQNQRTVDLFKIPKAIGDGSDDATQLQWVRNMTKDPEQFVKKVSHLYDHPRETSRDEIELKNGMILDRYSSPVFGKDGRDYGRMWTFRDITERKRASAEVQKSKERLRNLIDGVGPSIFVGLMTPQGILVECNRPALESAGLKPEDVLGKPFDKTPWWSHSPDAQKVLREAIARAAGGEASRFDIQTQGVGNQAIDVDFSLQPLRDETGKIVFLVPSASVITERTEALASLMESRQRLALATKSAHIGIWSWDVVANKLVWDTQMYELYGVREQDFSGAYDAWQKGLHPLDRERGDVAIHAALDGVKDFDVEFRVLWPNGEVREIEAHALVQRAADGSAAHMIGVNWDITERKRLEARLFESQKMESVGKLAGGIAHEFNSIMTAIIGQSELLLGDLPAGDHLRQNANEIRKAADRAAVLTRQLLAYGRKQTLQPKLLDLNAVLASMEGTLGHLMGRASEVRIVPAAELGAVKADAGQIEQVIMNMAMNAADAMPHGGKLTLETANVSFEQESLGGYPELKPGHYVMLAITDTGAGMSEEEKKRAFEPFFSTRGVGQGSGLGLSSSYGIIRQSGGHISVHSEPARGTTFKIYLPLAEAPAKVPIRRLDSPDLPRGTETILLVEDDPALREMAATLLKRLGYTVLAAANGIEALNLKSQHDVGDIELLLTDVAMPHMSGKELAARVRALHPHTRILFTSAYTENVTVNQGALGKDIALLQKPFTPSALARELRKVLDQPRVKDASQTPDAARLLELVR